MTAFVVGAVLVPAAAPAAEAHSLQLTQLDRSVLVSLNGIRAQHGLRPLRISSALTAAARQHSLEMGRVGYFAHTSANGGSFRLRVERYYPFTAGFRSWAIGENLVWRTPNLDAAGALRLWMASPAHRKNILTPGWREIGISAIEVATAPGVYGDTATTIITTDFGARN